jgi:hypothetical protein
MDSESQQGGRTVRSFGGLRRTPRRKRLVAASSSLENAAISTQRSFHAGRPFQSTISASQNALGIKDMEGKDGGTKKYRRQSKLVSVGRFN